MADEENRTREQEAQPDGSAPQPTPEEPKHYATRGQRIAALIAAIGVIIITLAYVYAMATGALFKA